VLVLLTFWGLAGASAAAASAVTVKPSSGSPKTRFVVTFRAPQSAGRVGAFERRYLVQVSGGASGCSSSGATNVTRAKAHHRVTVTLIPDSKGWCSGTYNGTVNEVQGPVCVAGKACPQFVMLVRRVGRFAFRVVSSATSAGTTTPAFAGLESATACTPGAQRPGQTTPFTLTWQPATDGGTPSSAIVYDVYLATTPGGEDFSKPTWITPAGVTTYRTPGLPSHGTFYFVVRARDQAGNEDQNKVERRGVDPCV
jgi:hypothetical protein